MRIQNSLKHHPIKNKWANAYIYVYALNRLIDAKIRVKAVFGIMVSCADL